MITEVLFNEKVGKLFEKWRREAGITQADMADKLGISRKSIGNLESGLSPSKLYTLFRWAEITKHEPEEAAPELKGIHHANDEGKIIQTIIGKARTFTTDELKGVAFIFFGNHGSHLRAFIQLCVAYLQCPMRDKQGLALMIINNYKNAVERGEIACPDAFQPDIGLLERAQEEGRKAFVNDKNKYFL